MKYINVSEARMNPSTPIVVRSTNGDTVTLAVSLNDLHAVREEKLERSTQRQVYKDELAICLFAATLNVYVQIEDDEEVDHYYDDLYEPALSASDMDLRAKNFLVGPQGYIRELLRPGTDREADFGLTVEDCRAIKEELEAQRIARDKRIGLIPND